MASGGVEVQGPGGRATKQDVVVVIDRDVRPAWETESLPDWVNYWLIPMLSAGQKWPEASETGLSKLSQAYYNLATGTSRYPEAAGRAARAIVAGCSAPSTAEFVGRARELCGNPAGTTAVTNESMSRAAEASNFAVETQYSKLSINVAFWVTVVAIAIALLVAFFTAGSTAPFVGPYAAAARAAITRILVRLTAIASRAIGPRGVAMLAALSGPTGRAAVLRFLASPIGKELVEEIGEEFFIDAYAQWEQMQMGTRTEWDWQKSGAAVVGAGGGAVIGTRLAGPMSHITDHVPGFAGRALNTGLTNAIASPFGSMIANTLVYRQWPPENPFTLDAMVGGFMGGAGRAGVPFLTDTTISPFNPDVYTAVLHPLSTLASASDLAAAADLARSGQNPSGPAGNGPTGNGPTGNGPDPSGDPSTGGPNMTGSGGTSTTGSGGTAGRTGQAGTQQGGSSSTVAGGEGTRRGSSTTSTDPDNQVVVTPEEEEEQTQPAGDPTTQATRPSAQQPDPQGRSQQPSTGEQNQASEPLTQGDPDTAQNPTAQNPDPGQTPSSTQNPDTGQNPTTAQNPDTGENPAASQNPDTGENSGTSQNPDTGETGENSGTSQNPDAAQNPDTGQDPAVQPTAATGEQAGTGQAQTSESGTTTTAATPSAPTAQQLAAAAAAREAAAPTAARKAIDEALFHVAPDALWLQNGDVRLTDVTGRTVTISAEKINSARRGLRANAKDGMPEEVLRVNAAAWLGAEIAGLAGRSRSNGAVDALEQLAELSEPSRAAATKAISDVLAGNPDARLSALIADDPGAGDGFMRPGFHDDSAADVATKVRALDPETANAPQAPPAAPTTRPGPRTSRTVVDTTLTADTRPPSQADLNDAEVKALVDGEAVKPSDLGRGVRSIVWSAGGPQLRVEMDGRPTMHFRLVYPSSASGGHPAVVLNSGTESDPHVLRLSGRLGSELVSVTLVQYLTHAAQELDAVAVEPSQGPIRGVLNRLTGRGDAETSQAAYVEARYNEHRHLARRWLNASSQSEQEALKRLMDAVAADLAQRGETAPTPPWIAGEQGVLPPAAPVAETPLAEATRLARGQADSLSRAVAGLEARIKAHAETAKKAKEAKKKALDDAKKADGQRDQFAKERARKARAEADKQQEIQRRHERIIRAYKKALTAARTVQGDYARLAESLHQLTAADPAAVTAAKSELAQAAEDAKRRVEAYKEALLAALPAPDAVANSMAEQLPHMTRLTQRINAGMLAQGIDEQFTVDDLHRALLGQWKQLISKEGVVLRVGVLSQGEVNVKLTVAELIEVIGHWARSGQMMFGRLPQGGLAIAAEMVRTVTYKIGGKLAGLVKVIPGVGSLVKLFSPGGELNYGRSRSTSGNALDNVVGGAVEDNRGEATPFKGRGTYTVRIRTSPQEGWVTLDPVDSGTSNDLSELHVWIGASHTDRPVRKPVTLAELEARHPAPAKANGAPAGQTGDTRTFPPSVTLNATGAEELIDGAMERLGKNAGSDTLRQLRNFVSEQWPSEMADAVNTGIQGKLSHNGREVARVELRTEPDYESARLAGTPSNERWKEDLGVAVTNSNGGQSSGFSSGGSVGIGRAFGWLAGLLQKLNPKAKSSWGVNANYGRSRSESVSAGGTAYKPVVDRSMAHHQDVVLKHKTVLVITMIEGDDRLDPVETTGEMQIVATESEAARAGMPFDPAAVVLGDDKQPLRNADGEIVLRDDPQQIGPKTGQEARPIWQGDQEHQFADAGFALVKGVTNLDRTLSDAITALRSLGLLPTPVDGELIYSEDEYEAAAQHTNQMEMEQQVRDLNVKTRLNQAIHQGILIPLVRNHAGESTQIFTLELKIGLDVTTTTLVAQDFNQAMALLYIGSDTNVVSAGHGHSGGLSGEVSAAHEPGENSAGFSFKARLGAALGGSTSSGSAKGDTGNDVLLHELLTDGKTETEGTVTATLRSGDSEPVVLSEHETTVSMAVPTAMLADPSRPPGQWQAAPAELIDNATMHHVDTTGLLPAARRLFSRFLRWGTSALHHVANFLGHHNVLSHAVKGGSPYTTGFAVNSRSFNQGRRWFRLPGPSRARLSLDWKPGKVRALGAHEGVIADIFLQLESLNTTFSASANGSVNAGVGAGYQNGKGANGSANAGWGKAGSIARSMYQLLIWGRERLAIDIGVQHYFQADGQFSMNAFPPGSVTPVGETVDGSAIFSVPEEVSLRLYAEGKLQLPPWMTADSVERWLDDNLELDRTVAVPLVQRYLMELRTLPADQRPELADRHTREALENKLSTLPGLADMMAAPDGHRLSAAAALAAKSRRVRLVNHLATKIGDSLIENVVFSLGGKRVNLLEQTMAHLARLAPGVLDADAPAPDKLYGSLNGRRWRGKVDNMTGRFGYHTAFTMRTGRLGRTERFRVRMHLNLDPDSVQDLGRTKTKVPLGQDYSYKQKGYTLSSGRNRGGSVDGGGANAVGGGNGSVSTDKNRSTSSSSHMQQTTVERFGGPADMHRLLQSGQLTVTMERLPSRFRWFGLRRAARRAADAVLHPERATETEFTVDLEMVRLVESTEIRPYEEGAVPELDGARDPRSFPLPNATKTETIEQDGSLYDSLRAAVAFRHGEAAAREVEDQLQTMTDDLTLIALLKRMTAGEGLLIGEVNPRSASGLGQEVTLQARTFKKGVVVGVLEDREGGDVQRFQHEWSTTVSTGTMLPLGRGAGGSHGPSSVSAGVSSGEQATDRYTVGRGSRVEHTTYTRGRRLKVAFEVAFDATLTEVGRTVTGRRVRGPSEFLPEAGTATVVVEMFEGQFNAINAAIEAGVPLGAGWVFAVPTFENDPIVWQGQVTEEAPWRLLNEARTVASRGRPVVLDQVEPDGTLRRYLLDDNGVHSLPTDPNDPEALLVAADNGFAEAFGTLPQPLLDLAIEHNLPLRQIFFASTVEGTLSDKVRAELEDRGVPYAEPTPAFPAQPAEETPAVDPAMAGSDVGQGGVSVQSAVSATSPAIPGTPYDPSARAGSAPLTMDDLRQRIPTAEELGDGFVAVRLMADGRTLEVATAKHGILYTQLNVGEVVSGDNAVTSRGTAPDDPATTVINEHADPVIVKATVAHEIVHLLQWAAAEQNGAGQGVVRGSLPSAEQQEGRDHCLEPRLREHAVLSSDWRQASDPAVQLRIAQAIDAVAADIVARGHLAPEPPWGSGPPVTSTPARGSIAALLNTGAGPVLGSAATIGAFDTTPTAADALSRIANVDSVTATGPGRFEVKWPGGQFTLVVSEADLAPGEVRSYPQLGRPGELVIEVSQSGGRTVTTGVAARIAERIAELEGLPPGRTMARGAADPRLEESAPVLGREDLAVLARLRARIEDLADAPRLARRQREDALRAQAARAGLEPGTPGARTRLIAAARAGQLSPAQVDAILSLVGHQPTAAVNAAVAAVERAARRAGASVRRYGNGLLDIVIPGHAPVAVELTAHRGLRSEPFRATVEEHVATFQVATFGSIGAIEREAAAAAVGAIAARLNLPSGPALLTREPVTGGQAVLTTADHQNIARLWEAARQVEAATPQQRRSRLLVLIAMADSMGVGQDGPNRSLLPPSLVDSLVTRVDNRLATRQAQREERMEQARRRSNTTGWYPPEDEEECLCPPDEACVCGRRRDGSGGGPAPAPSATPASAPTPAATPSVTPAPAPTPTPVRRVVGSGDSLADISEDVYGDERYWPEIWKRNRDLIGPDPGALKEGMELVMPEKVGGP